MPPKKKKTGRNEPCPCGSGVKYKKCCMAKDQPRPKSKARSTPTTPARAVIPAVNKAGPSLAGVAADTTARIASAGFELTPYTTAKIAQNPRSAGNNKALRAAIERALREDWTIKKVASMSTEAIEAQLTAYGVHHTRERFLHLAEGRTSAWPISDEWIATDPVTCRGKEEDFLGLAACELWKRYLPDRPSTEMIDDWMQDGYTLQGEHKLTEACDIWWNVWCTLRPRFTPEMTTMDATTAVFSGLQSVFNWSQDFETELGNAARKDVSYAAKGCQYCTEWIAQFPDENDGMQVNFHRALASFHFCVGETTEAAATLHSIVERWPQSFWGYIALADAHSHFFPGEYDLEYDLDKAIGYLHKALSLPGLESWDRQVVEDRLSELRGRQESPEAPPAS